MSPFYLQDEYYNAPIAQLDRASGYGPEGLGFESLWVYKLINR